MKNKSKNDKEKEESILEARLSDAYCMVDAIYWINHKSQSRNDGIAILGDATIGALLTIAEELGIEINEDTELRKMLKKEAMEGIYNESLRNRQRNPSIA